MRVSRRDIPRPPPITLSVAAAEFLSHGLAGREAKILSFGLDRKGCSGFSYRLEPIESAADGETFDAHGVTLHIKPQDFLAVFGTEIDLETVSGGHRIVFRNPNEKSRCGCGKSFCV